MLRFLIGCNQTPGDEQAASTITAASIKYEQMKSIDLSIEKLAEQLLLDVENNDANNHVENDDTNVNVKNIINNNTNVNSEEYNELVEFILSPKKLLLKFKDNVTKHYQKHLSTKKNLTDQLHYVVEHHLHHRNNRYNHSHQHKSHYQHQNQPNEKKKKAPSPTLGKRIKREMNNDNKESTTACMYSLII